jgi:hypothetical protein
MALDTNALAMAEEALGAKVVDTVLQGNLITKKFLGSTKSWEGTKMGKSIIIAKPGTGMSFSGMDRFNTNTSDTKVKLQFEAKGYTHNVVIPQMEADLIASSPSQAAEFVALHLQEAANSMADDIGSLLYADGTASSKNIQGLDAIIDDGGEVATYGGLSRSTYTTIKANETDLGGALTQTAMASMFDLCEVGNDRPTMILTTPAVWSKYEALNQTYINANYDSARKVGDGLNGELGYAFLAYRGVPVYKDDKCTAQKMFFVNEKHIGFYRLKSTDSQYKNMAVGSNKDIEGVYSDPSGIVGFDFSGFQRPIDQYGLVGHFILMGDLVSFNPNRHGVINTIS